MALNIYKGILCTRRKLNTCVLKDLFNITQCTKSTVITVITVKTAALSAFPSAGPI